MARAPRLLMPESSSSPSRDAAAVVCETAVASTVAAISATAGATRSSRLPGGVRRESEEIAGVMTGARGARMAASRSLKLCVVAAGWDSTVATCSSASSAAGSIRPMASELAVTNAAMSASPKLDAVCCRPRSARRNSRRTRSRARSSRASRASEMTRRRCSPCPTASRRKRAAGVVGGLAAACTIVSPPSS